MIETKLQDFRSKFGVGLYRTKAGVIVRSKAEMIIGDILTDLGVSYCYERMLILGNKEIYPDFTVIEKNLVIEYHQEELEFKKKLYDTYGIQNIILNSEDMTNIHDKLRRELRKYYPERNCWV